MEIKNTKTDKPKVQLIGATLVMITGLFVMLAMANTITGKVTGDLNGGVGISEISIALWGLLIIAIGVWIIKRKDFNKSVFDQ